MPGCCVKDCNNRSERRFRLFRVPKNKERRHEWLQLIGRDTLPERAEICEMHFDENQFENNRADKRKLLRPYGKPNLLHLENNSNEVTNNMSTNNDKYEDNANNLNDNSYSNINNGDNTITELEIISTDCGTNKSNHFEATDVVVMSDTASNKNLDEIIKNFEEQIKKLKKSLNKTVVERNILKRKLQKENARFNEIFNEDQKDFITRKTQRGTSWSADTITKALKLYAACGQKGYEEVLRQHLPYPSIRTLQSRIQGLKFKPGKFLCKREMSAEQ
ncbi:probable basic-leucine zipper transcription factor K [Nylanderia fulva]|uniref:probable basic-leucine zipper transcription factor K n=1 Tax=Nylanderia fulva TaxID=613905 RepID=UPI0010FB40AF|nr:probable basic-leucine zipper transcription factor K [Nylanderia fulva]XP_029177900.1 probable basic-leucine zipper transcription factor K [Nylanderia fulva]